MAVRPRFSIVVPAHNEEQLLGRGLVAIDEAVRTAGATAEVVVAANRCTDRTEAIATEAGATVVIDGHRNIAATRNAGVAASAGEIVVTIDADTNRIDVEVDAKEMERRRAAWTAPPYKSERGTLYKYIKNVKNASEGCVTDE